MGHSAPLIILVPVLLTGVHSYCSAENVYCVAPTATSCSDCPHNSTHCATLSEYALEAKKYFTSDTTMMFLPGDHILDTNITVANITWLTMCRDSSSGTLARIVRNESVGLSFTNTIGLKIYSLAFTSHIGSWSCSHPAKNFALHLLFTQSTELVNCSFQNNLGSALFVKDTNIILAKNNEFTHNHCKSEPIYELGCGITAFNSNLTFTGKITFLENTANFSVIVASSSSLYFNGTNNFIGNVNSAEYGVGGAIHVTSNTLLSFSGVSIFDNNSAISGGAIHAVDNSELNFNGISNFSGNIATQGGAIYMSSDSFFSSLPNNIAVYWESNHATLGGAIYIDDDRPLSYCNQLQELIDTNIPKEKCFFQLSGQNTSKGIDAKLVFKNNSADTTGSVLFGGAIDNCKLIGLESHSSGEVFNELVHIEDDNTNSSISSYPFRICTCENDHPQCSEDPIRVSVHPGETFQVSVVATGQRSGIYPEAVIGKIGDLPSSDANLLGWQYLQQATNNCTTLSYTVFALSKLVRLKLYANGPCSTFGNSLLVAVTLFHTCPPGFNFSESERSCVCEKRLQKYTHQCNITNKLGRITCVSGKQFWVGYDDQSHGLILHPHCPFDYCVTHTVNFTLNHTDRQCENNRSCLLCGACMMNHSLVLGTSHCKPCTNSHIALLILFAVMGVALVFILFVCKLTVATGVLSGLVFYANIVGVNRAIFLPEKSPSFLSVFIAWLNLNFGIETCFYHGMDAYGKTWLHYVFPLYLCCTIGLMVLMSNFSCRFANLLGKNPISVFGTLILLSYTKILQASMAAINITYLQYPNYTRGVWLHDANIDYLVGKHIPLFLFALLVLLFFLSYTFLLLFGQWLQAISHLRLFSWVNRLKPFLDAYHAPYKAKHRYWPGLLLVLRFVLLLVFGLNSQEDTSSNLLAIILALVVLQLWAWISGGVYKNWCFDALEGFFTVNLIFLCAITDHASVGNQLAVGYTSISLAFVVFIGVLFYQLADVTGLMQHLKKYTSSKVTTTIRYVCQAEAAEKLHDDSLPDRMINPGNYAYGSIS